MKNRGSPANDDKFDLLIVKRFKKLLNVGCQHDAFAPLFSTPQRPLWFRKFRLRRPVGVQERRS